MPASERTLSFTGQMAAAIRAGDKTQTRRLLAPSKVFVDGRVTTKTRDEWGRLHIAEATVSEDGQKLFVPWIKWRAGQGVSVLTSRVFPDTRVAVKEPVIITPDRRVYYHDDPPPAGTPIPRPPRFMPYAATRMWLRIEAVRFERLHDITQADALAEGVSLLREPRAAFADLWTVIHGADSWASNPWVLAITFELAEVRDASR